MCFLLVTMLLFDTSLRFDSCEAALISVRDIAVTVLREIMVTLRWQFAVSATCWYYSF
jgi:hypothetical protein